MYKFKCYSRIVPLVFATMMIFLFCNFACSKLNTKANNKNILKEFKKIELKSQLKNKRIYSYLALFGDDFIIFDEYKDIIIITLYDNSFKKKKYLVINKKKYKIDDREILNIKQVSRNELMLQGYKKNLNYDRSLSNKSEPFHNRRVIIIDRNLQVINDFQVKRMGIILPQKIKNNYFLLGNFIHLINKPKIQNEYILYIKNNGNIEKRISARKKYSDIVIADIEEGEINYYNNDLFYTIKNYDISKSLNSNAKGRLKQKFCMMLYALNINTGTLIKSYNFTNQFKVQFRNYKKSTTNGLIRPYIQFFNKYDSTIVMQIFEFKKKTACGKIINTYFGQYNINKKKFQMMKEKNNLYRLSGVNKNYLYYWNWKDRMLKIMTYK